MGSHSASNDLRVVLKRKGYTDLPESSTTIRNRVVKYSQQIRIEINDNKAMQKVRREV